MPDKKSALEQHRRHIKQLKASGGQSGIKRTFEKAAESQTIRKYKGVCSVCGQPFYAGFAVRCSVCKNSIFHPACFGTHVMQHHSPMSVTVVVSDTDKEDVWHFVDAEHEEVEDVNVQKEPAEEVKVEEEVKEVPEEVEEVEIATIATSEPNVVEPEPEPKPEPVTREKRAVRTKKRQQVSE